MSRRRVQVLKGDSWVDMSMCDLKKGDMFCVYEENGDPVFDEEGSSVFTAVNDAYPDSEDEDGVVWGVDCE